MGIARVRRRKGRLPGVDYTPPNPPPVRCQAIGDEGNEYPHYYVRHRLHTARMVRVHGVIFRGREWQAYFDVRACTAREAFALARAEGLYPIVAVRGPIPRRRGVPQPAARRVCDDCHAVQMLRAAARRLRDEAKPAEDAAETVAPEDPPPDQREAEIVAGRDAAEASPSGQAIQALGEAAVLDEATGELLGVEIVESALLPESESALLTEIKAGVLACDDPAQYRRQVRRALQAAGGNQREVVV